MGQTKRQRKKYSTPTHPLQKDRIIEEKELTKEYGLKNKKEIWKSTEKLRKVSNQVKNIIANKTLPQAQKEKDNLISHLIKYKLIAKGTEVDDILDLTTKDFLERRLQTIVFKKRLSNSVKQARQMIVHGHIIVDNKKVTIPSYLVNADEENKVMINPTSNFTKQEEEIKPNAKAKKEIIEKEDSKKENSEKKEVEIKKELKIEEKPTEKTPEKKPVETEKKEEVKKE